ncbi:MAG: hypothetical protein K1X29_02860 [Bdellovibrionales bacterium]|nr:hypothetical protein [Bdellovibrionales bacterium]
MLKRQSIFILLVSLLASIQFTTKANADEGLLITKTKELINEIRNISSKSNGSNTTLAFNKICQVITDAVDFDSLVNVITGRFRNKFDSVNYDLFKNKIATDLVTNLQNYLPILSASTLEFTERTTPDLSFVQIKVTLKSKITVYIKFYFNESKKVVDFDINSIRYSLSKKTIIADTFDTTSGDLRREGLSDENKVNEVLAQLNFEQMCPQ